MLVDFAIVAERDQRLTAFDAIRRAALMRFRPIIMTTMAALLGGIALMLGQGTGSEVRQPLGYALVRRQTLPSAVDICCQSPITTAAAARMTPSADRPPTIVASHKTSRNSSHHVVRIDSSTPRSPPTNGLTTRYGALRVLRKCLFTKV
jgi:hypothetical protein